MKYLADYHLHSKFSIDSREEPRAHIEQAMRLGLSELCFTEHAEFDPPESVKPEDWYLDFYTYTQTIEELQAEYPQLKIRIGYELGLPDFNHSMEKCKRQIPAYDFDFVIASLHYYEGINVFEPKWYNGLSYPEACRKYVRATYEHIQKLRPQDYSVIGHINAPSKLRPEVSGTEDVRVHYEWIADEFDMLAKHVIEDGKSFELNTSSWRQLGNMPSLDIVWLKRLHELGAEYLSFGSDAHTTKRLGYRLADAQDLARAAGFKYFATFDKMQAIMHKL